MNIINIPLTNDETGAPGDSLVGLSFPNRPTLSSPLVLLIWLLFPNIIKTKGKYEVTALNYEAIL